MAHYSKKEFALLCGLPTKNLSTYIGRGKVNVLPSNLIDSDDLLNKAFVEMRKDHVTNIEKSISTPSETVMSAAVQTVIVEVPAKKTKKERQKEEAQDQSLYQAKLEVEQSKLAKTDIDVRLKELEYQKRMGELMNVSTVKDIVAELGKSMMKNYSEGASNFLTEFGRRKRLSVEELAEMRGVLVKIINRFHEMAIREAAAQIELNHE